MKPIKVFISSGQKEFAKERKALAHYFRDDALLHTFFVPFIFKETDLIAPSFNIDEGFKVVLWRPSVNTAHDTDYVTDHVTDNVNELIKRLIIILSNPKSRPELMEQLELSHNPNFRDNYLKPAMKLGYIEMTEPDRPKSTKQQYRLTAKGIALRKSLINK